MNRSAWRRLISFVLTLVGGWLIFEWDTNTVNEVPVGYVGIYMCIVGVLGLLGVKYIFYYGLLDPRNDHPDDSPVRENRSGSDGAFPVASDLKPTNRQTPGGTAPSTNPLQIIKCGHCGRRVAPKADNTCPSCHAVIPKP